MTQKRFTADAAAAFLSTPEPRQEEEKKPESISVVTFRQAHNIGEESKTRRCHVLIKPSLHERSKALAQGQRVSFNQLVELALEEYLERHATED